MSRVERYAELLRKTEQIHCGLRGSLYRIPIASRLAANGYKIIFLQRKNVTSLVPCNLDSNRATGFANL